MLTGATWPASIRRTLESPEADTPSYSPVDISWNISSEVLPILTSVLQPVSSSKGPTQL